MFDLWSQRLWSAMFPESKRVSACHDLHDIAEAKRSTKTFVGQTYRLISYVSCMSSAVWRVSLHISRAMLMEVWFGFILTWSPNNIQHISRVANQTHSFWRSSVCNLTGLDSAVRSHQSDPLNNITDLRQLSENQKCARPDPSNICSVW